MRGTEPGPVVAVEVLVEQRVMPPGILLEALGSPEHRPGAVRCLFEDRDESAPDLCRHFLQVHHHATAGRALDGEVVAQVEVVALQRLDDEMVDGEPHRSAPIGVAAVDRRRGLRGLVVDAVLLAIEIDLVRRSLESLRHRAQAVRRQHRVLAQHLEQHASQAIGVDDREERLIACLVLAHLEEAGAVVVLVRLLADAAAPQEVRESLLVARG